ncbi:MAG: hypothetical protein IIC51_00575 [Planctomycetes bacterium]|nr:hypothetical protein [Planctomycetota bacterium]
MFSVGTTSDKRNIITSPQRGLATVAVGIAIVGIALVGTLAISRLIVSLAQEPLRPTLSQRQAPTPRNQQVNRQAAPDTTPRTILEQVVSAVTNNPLVAGLSNAGQIFQTSYDNDSGERTIAVNDGGISFDITTKSKYLYIDLKEDGTYFKVQDNGLDVFRVDYDKNVIVHQGATLHLLGALKDNTGSWGDAGQVLTAPPWW